MATQSKTSPEEINGVNLSVLRQTVSSIEQDPALGKCRFRASNKWIGGTQNQTTLSSFYAAKEEMTHQQSFTLNADEPPLLAGSDQAANPVEHLLNALASCMTTSMVAHAAVRGIQIEELESHLEGDLDMRGFLGLSSDVPPGFTAIRAVFRVKADDANLKKLRELVDFSPVLSTITRSVPVSVEVEPKGR